MSIKRDCTGRGKCRTQQMAVVCVSSTAHICDVVPDVDEEEEEGGSLRTLSEGALDFNMF